MATALPPALQPLLVPRDALRPPSADNPRLGLSMSLVAHAALVAALALGVQWRTETPAGVSAELWAATPQLAAPPRPTAEPAPAEPAETAETAPPAAPPPPRPAAPEPAAAAEEREAEIAVAKAEQLRKDKLRLEAEQRRARDEKAKAEKAQAEKAQAEKAQAEKARQDKLDKAQADKRLKEREAQQQAEALRKEKDKEKEKAQERAADAQREKQRQEQMRRMNEQLGGGPSGHGAPGSTGTAARDAGPSASYAGRILARIKPNIVLTDEVTGNPRAEVEMKVAADGSIIGRRISKSSGSKVWDEAVLRAVDRTAVLPRDTDGRVPSTIVIGFKPQE